MNVPLEERRKVLSEIFEKVRSKASPIKLSETIDATPTELVRVAKQLGFEGILAKRRDSYYESGKRSGAWLKYRINRGQELVIGGYVSGNPIDSIIVGYYQDGTLLYAGKVRNGFVPHTRRAVAAKLRGLEIATCPFANLPERKRTQWALTKEKMKNCTWVSPEVGMEVHFSPPPERGQLLYATQRFESAGLSRRRIQFNRSADAPGDNTYSRKQTTILVACVVF